MSELVQKILLLARFEAGAMTFVFEQVPFRTVLEEAVQRFEARASYEKSSSSFAAAAIRISCATGSGSWKLYPI